uniref:Uncharacterized protein n=1 Tax=Sphaeramia orbicularis TaxID=375764 RepID=A0A672YU58_9TELE
NMGTIFWTFSLLALPGLESAKILTVCLIGGSHYLLLDDISHNLQQHGHEVRMLLQLGNPVITGEPHTQTYILDCVTQSQFFLGRYRANFS